MVTTPPTPAPHKLDLELKLCPVGDREDAVQEAWLATLEGRDPARAVNTYAQRQRRYRRRERASGDTRRLDNGLAATSASIGGRRAR
jgi:hypothetical protein